MAKAPRPKPKRRRPKPKSEPTDWRVETVRAVREALQSLARTARLAALLLAVGVAVIAVAWLYQAVTARPDPGVQISVSLTNR
jgi:hypothetical protein